MDLLFSEKRKFTLTAIIDSKSIKIIQSPLGFQLDTQRERTSCRAVVRASSVVILELLRNNFERGTKMADFNVRETIDLIENSELKKLFLHLFTKLSAKDERILALENRVAKLEERVDECEKYSSKDCLIFENLPIKKPEGKVPTLKHQVCDFLLKYLNWETPT